MAALPEGPSTQYLRTLVPKAIKGMVLRTRNLKYWVLGPSPTRNLKYWVPGPSGDLNAHHTLTLAPKDSLSTILEPSRALWVLGGLGLKPIEELIEIPRGFRGTDRMPTKTTS